MLLGNKVVLVFNSTKMRAAFTLLEALTHISSKSINSMFLNGILIQKGESLAGPSMVYTYCTYMSSTTAVIFSVKYAASRGNTTFLQFKKTVPSWNTSQWCTHSFPLSSVRFVQTLASDARWFPATDWWCPLCDTAGVFWMRWAAFD